MMGKKIGSKISKILGGPGEPENVKELESVQVKAHNYKGPFSKMKAKKAIRRGETDFAVARKKSVLTGKEKSFSYVDRFPMPEKKRGSNDARLGKKKVGDKVRETKAYGQYKKNQEIFRMLQD